MVGVKSGPPRSPEWGKGVGIGDVGEFGLLRPRDPSSRSLLRMTCGRGWGSARSFDRLRMRGLAAGVGFEVKSLGRATSRSPLRDYRGGSWFPWATRFFVAEPPQNDIWWERGKRGMKLEGGDGVDGGAGAADDDEGVDAHHEGVASLFCADLRQRFQKGVVE